jgi:hypothetical protein
MLTVPVDHNRQHKTLFYLPSALWLWMSWGGQGDISEDESPTLILLVCILAVKPCLFLPCFFEWSSLLVLNLGRWPKWQIFSWISRQALCMGPESCTMYVQERHSGTGWNHCRCARQDMRAAQPSYPPVARSDQSRRKCWMQDWCGLLLPTSEQGTKSLLLWIPENCLPLHLSTYTHPWGSQVYSKV